MNKSWENIEEQKMNLKICVEKKNKNSGQKKNKNKERKNQKEKLWNILNSQIKQNQI